MKSAYPILFTFSALGAILFSACGSSQGSEGAACYGNGTCDAGLVCQQSNGENKCVDASTNTGIDLTACFECGDAACSTERGNCDGTTGCAEILDCTIGCGTDVSCSSQCNVSGLTQEQLVAAGMAVTSYVSCAVPKCLTECSPDLGTGGGTGSGGGTSTGGAGNIDSQACLSCAEDACPTELSACQGTTGCVDFVECGVGCGDDDACGQNCGAGLTQEQLTNLAAPALDYLTCAAVSCASACSTDGGGSGGSPGTGGVSGSGGSTSTGGGNGSGGGSTLGPGELFTGDGVGIDAPTYGAVGSFFVLEDSVANGALVSDSLTHTDLDPPDSSAEPSTFEQSARPCVSGTVAVVTDPSGANCQVNSDACAWGDLWGGGIGMSLNETAGTASAWNATAVGVTGFTFQTSGSVDGVPVRFFVEDTSGNQFCTSTTTGSKTVPFSSLSHECWSPTTLKLDPAEIKQISWQFVPDASYPYSISNFCVEAVGVTE